MRVRFAKPRASRLAAVAALMIPAGLAMAASDPWDAPDAKWRQGPVKWLLGKEEDQAYKKLKADDERSRFVEEFWSKRDPTPGTPENEYRTEFYRRAREAAARFTEDGGQGWQDDRGRVFIILGPPTETSQATGLIDSPASPSTAAPTAFGATGGEAQPTATTRSYKFIYLADPFSGKKGRFELNFTSEATGGYRLDEKIDWNDPRLRGLASLPPEAAPASAPTPAPIPPPAPAPAPEVPSVPPEPETTPQSELMQQVRSSADLTAAIPLDVTINYYKAADKSTFATITLEVKRSALPAEADPTGLLIAAEVLDVATGQSEQRFFKTEHFGSFEGNLSAGINDTLLYQAERPLKPGAYKIVFALKDPVSGQMGKLEKELTVPSYESDEFTLSTVTLARKVERLDPPPADDQPKHFILGKSKVVPRPDNVYRHDEEILFYYQIYGAASDPILSAPKVDISYAVEVQLDGKWRMLGGKPILAPAQQQLVQAYGFPLKGRPSGDYRLTIAVTDTVAGKTAKTEIPFTVLPAPGASKAKAKSKG